MTNIVSFPALGIGELTLRRVAFTLLGKDIYWYGIVIAVGFIVAFIYVMRRLPDLGVKSDDLIDCLLFGVVAAIVGARLLFVFTYKNSAGINTYFDGEHDFKDIISIWNGGSAIYGGLILCVIVLFFVARHKKMPVTPILDAAAMGLPIGQAIGRWGNFINCEAYGTVTDGLFGMSINGGAPVHPIFFYECVWNIVVFLLVHTVSRKNRRLYDGQLFMIYIGVYGFGRGFIELIRADDLLMAGGLRVSAVIAFGCALIGALAFVYTRFVRKPDKARLYVNRIAAETVEETADAAEPDAPVAAAETVGETADANAAETVEPVGETAAPVDADGETIHSGNEESE